MTDDIDSRIVQQFAQARLLHQQGQLDAARAAYQRILDAAPDHFDALNAMGVLAGQMRDLPQAIRCFDRAIAVEPGHSGAHCNRGLALKQLRQPEAALACFERAIELDPRSAIAQYSRAETYKDLGRSTEAIASYEACLELDPGFLHAHYRRALVLQQNGRLDEAIAGYDRVIALKPDHFDAHANKAFSSFTLGRAADALQSADRAIALKPEQASVHTVRGSILRALNRREEALTEFERAIALDPSDAEAHCNCGIVLLLLERLSAAISSFDRAIALKPDYVDAYFHRGYSHRMLERFDLARADYEAVAAIAPDFDFLPGSRLEAALQICDWSDFEELHRQIVDGLEQGRRVAHPFIFMALDSSARLQQRVARAWVDYDCPADDSLGPIARRARPARLKLGYFSSDFHEHPIGRLVSELIEIHDRSRFEVAAFSFGPTTGDEIQERLVRAFDEFNEVRQRSSAEIAALARRAEVDIAIDLGGHTYNNRAAIFARRAAPLQLHYLGYLGTLGASYMDYIVADRTAITPASESYYSEKVIYLPDCHQANDRKRRIADRTYTRAELGLPPAGFVFCCFNTSYKIMPATFSGWMRILSAVPGSVLLLYTPQQAAEVNLRTQAARHGVDPTRLVFGERLAPAEYLARYRAADLFLDTLPYNAGTTASDALWTGVPVVTLPGESFASRIASSLLVALGLPELIASSQEHYERLAIELASKPQRLQEIRGKLQQNRLTGPLFDTPRFARNLEAAYLAIHERYQAGLAPDHIRLPGLP